MLTDASLECALFVVEVAYKFFVRKHQKKLGARKETNTKKVILRSNKNGTKVIHSIAFSSK